MPQTNAANEFSNGDFVLTNMSRTENFLLFNQFSIAISFCSFPYFMQFRSFFTESCVEIVEQIFSLLSSEDRYNLARAYNIILPPRLIRRIPYESIESIDALFEKCTLFENFGEMCYPGKQSWGMRFETPLHRHYSPPYDKCYYASVTITSEAVSYNWCNSVTDHNEGCARCLASDNDEFDSDDDSDSDTTSTLFCTEQIEDRSVTIVLPNDLEEYEKYWSTVSNPKEGDRQCCSEDEDGEYGEYGYYEDYEIYYEGCSNW